MVVVKGLGAVRWKMASLEKGSERYKKYASKKSVKIATFRFVGGKKGKKSWEDLAKNKIGNPVRIPGVVLAVLIVGLLVVVQMMLGEKIMTAALTGGLERANGATVDVGAASLSLQDGKLSVEGLAMADPNALETDLLRAGALVADLSSKDLRRRRLAFDSIRISDASSGETRAAPGVLVGRKSEPTPPPPPTEGEKTIEDYIKQGEMLQERLTQARDWLEKLGGRKEPGAESEGDGPTETLRKRLAREARTNGYANVYASHLIDGSPTVLERELVIDGIVIARLDGEKFDVTGSSLSTQPWLVDEAPTFQAVSDDQNIRVAATLGQNAKTPGGSTFAVKYHGLPGDEIGRMLAAGGSAPISGGTVDVNLSGTIDGVSIDAPMRVVLKNTTINVPGAGPTEVEELELPIGVRGPIDNPQIMVDDDALADALVAAGKARAAEAVRGQADKAIDKALDDNPELKKRVGDALGGCSAGTRRTATGSRRDSDFSSPIAPVSTRSWSGEVRLLLAIGQWLFPISY